MRSAKYAPTGCNKFASMGIDESNPISTGLACSLSRKLVSNTPLVVAEKIVASTPSRVDACRLVRIPCLKLLFNGGAGTIGAGAGKGSRIFKDGLEEVSTEAKSDIVKLSKGHG